MEATTEQPSLYTEDQRSRLFNFSEAHPELKRLIDAWSDEVTKSDNRRTFRKVEIDVEQKRREGKLDADEQLLPVRVVDENIEKEMPPYVAYLTQAQNIALFLDTISPSTDTALLSQSFSKGMKYLGWEKVWFRCIDGAELHGTDAIEVVLDLTKPLHVGTEHVGHDCLFFSRDCINIQDAPYVLRKYSFSADKLRESVAKSGWNAEVCKELIEEIKNDGTQSTTDIYKAYFKYEGVVYIAWFAPNKTQAWLKAPEKLQVGVRTKKVTDVIRMPGEVINGLPVLQPTPDQVVEWIDEYETMYPIFQLIYKETEEKKIVDKKGRAFLDQYRQEGQTSVLSGYVNALNRSTSFCAWPKTQTGSGTAPKQTATFIGRGMFSEPMEVWKPEYPDSVSILGALQYIDAGNARDINQISEALRRKKGEKTAREVEEASKETQMLSGVKLILFSTFVREVYTYAWRIVQSQALQGLIAFMLKGTNAGGKFLNDDAVISRSYTVLAAGDEEVIQRAQKIDRMMNFWPIVSTTSMRDAFLIKLIRMLFPEDAPEYEAVFQANNVTKQLLGTTSNMLKAMIQKHPEEVQTLPPDQQKQLAGLEQAVQQTLSMP